MTRKEIDVAVKASIAQFQNQMRRAAMAVKAFGASAMTGVTQVRALGAAALGLLAGGALTAIVKNAYETADAVAKSSDQLGIATEKLIGYQHAAGLAGIEGEAFNKALARMVRSVADAADKGGAAEDALKKIGVQAKALAGLTPDQQFEEITAAMQRLPSAAARVQAAYQIFGRQGVALISLMQGGVAGLRAGVEEAQRFGTAINRIDGAKIEAANDNISRVREVFKGIATQIAVQTAPVVSDLAERFIGVATQGEGVGQRVGGAMGHVAKATAYVADAARVVQMGYLALKSVVLLVAASGITAMGELYKVAVKSVNGLISAANKIPGIDIGLLGEDFSGVDAFTQSFRDDVKATTAEFNALKNAPWPSEKVDAYFAEVQQKAQETATVAAASAQAMGDAALPDLDGIDAMADAAKRLTEDVRTPMEVFQSELQEINKLYKAGAIDATTYQRAVAAAQGRLAAATQKGNVALEDQAALMDTQKATGSADQVNLARTAIQFASNAPNPMTQEKNQQRQDSETFKQILTELRSMNRSGFAGVYA